ncbi:MAG: DNA recombination protein RmuC, partial [Rhodospirillales bacterium]|nr:DNA recombination protein RmuC [Rhodospirillales bacterium]
MNPSPEGMIGWLLLALPALATGAALFALSRAVNKRTAAEIRLAETEKALLDAAARREAAEATLEEMRTTLQGAENKVARADQQVADMRGQMTDWEKTRKEYIEAAKAGALETARELSNKLLEDHKRETNAAKKENEERTKKIHDEFEKIVGSVASLSDQVGESRKTMDNVHRALSNPGEAGQFAEIGLENQLKNFGLEPGLDFSMQHTIAGDGGEGILRPDAVVFLPGESVMVIDSKASKFLLDLSQADDAMAEEAAYQSLANTMREHLKGLASKNYQNAVTAGYRAAGHGGKLRHVVSVMYLPSDGTLEHLLRIDPDFKRRAQKSDIIVVGPSGLTALIAVARLNINSGRQAENQALIVDGTRAFLEAVSTALEHMDKVGKGI